jgi:trans-2,3-dihydro-3-hydroxyanthranilate isomerase
MDLYKLDVFCEGPYSGNQLAVVTDPGDLTKQQMQAIAKEMNIAETTFVMDVSKDAYSMRIFTPDIELPFAGHPTIGTAWMLRKLGLLTSTDVTQRTAAGDTQVTITDEGASFERKGRAERDLEDSEPAVASDIAKAIGIDESEVGLEPRELGRDGRLRPAIADTGIPVVVVPVANAAALGRSTPARPAFLAERGWEGLYVFTARGAGQVQARGYMGGYGIGEDPATGSAAGSLGVYMADRLGDISFSIAQGIEMGRPSRIEVNATTDSVVIGGRCEAIMSGRLEALP